MHILIVEDDVLLLRTLVRGLKSYDITAVTPLSSPDEVGSVLTGTTLITHILSDTEMQGVKRAGPDMYLKYQSIIQAQKIKFVAMTGSHDPAVQAPWVELGIPVILKPFTIDELLTVLKK